MKKAQVIILTVTIRARSFSLITTQSLHQPQATTDQLIL